METSLEFVGLNCTLDVIYHTQASHTYLLTKKVTLLPAATYSGEQQA